MTIWRFTDLISAHFRIVETSTLSILALILEACLDSGFECPEDKVFGAFYSLAFLFIPYLILIMLTVTIDPRARDHQRIRCKQFFASMRRSCCCCCSSRSQDSARTHRKKPKITIRYTTAGHTIAYPPGNMQAARLQMDEQNVHMQTQRDQDSAQEESRNRSCCESIPLCLLELIVLLTLKAPLLWVSAMLTDGRYSTCFIKSTFGSHDLQVVKQITQIVGLALFLLLFSVACKKDKGAMLKCWYVKKYEDLLLQDVDTELRKKAAEGRAKFVAEHLSNMSWEGFNPKNADAEEVLDHIIQSHQEEINKQLKREAEV